MTKRHLKLAARLGAALTAIGLAVAGCGSSHSSASGQDHKTITMGVVQGWTDQTGTAYVFKDVLEKHGYTVNIKELSDNAPIYTGLAKGDLDVLSSSWLERTHKKYWAQYGSKLEDLGIYYKDASLYLAVPSYSDIKSIDDLNSHAAELGNQVVGIEPGAGLTSTTRDAVFPAYGLNGNFKLVQSSTTAMLTELKKAEDAKKPIVVTMWKPFWANTAYNVRKLDDPKGAFGPSESLHEIARKGFSKDNPKVAAMMANLKLDDQQWDALEDTMTNKFPKGQEAQAAQAWLDAHPDVAHALDSSLQS